MLKRVREDSEVGYHLVRKKIAAWVRRSAEEADALKIRVEIRKKEKEFDELSLRAGKMILDHFQKTEGAAVDPDLKGLIARGLAAGNELARLKSELAERLGEGSRERGEEAR
jgi:hypothetical protein